MIKIELKKLAQYWKNNIFKKNFGTNLLNKFLFLSKKSFLSNQNFDTENLYKINKELISNKNKKVKKVLLKNNNNMNKFKLKIDIKKSKLKLILLFLINLTKIIKNNLIIIINNSILKIKLLIFKWLNQKIVKSNFKKKKIKKKLNNDIKYQFIKNM